VLQEAAIIFFCTKKPPKNQGYVQFIKSGFNGLRVVIDIIPLGVALATDRSNATSKRQAYTIFRATPTRIVSKYSVRLSL